MKNILVIMGDYYPHPSSNTNCVDPLLKGLEQHGWHIDIVTVKQWLELPTHEVEEGGREVWRIDDPRSMNTILQNQICSIPAPGWLGALNKFFALASKSLFYMRYCLRASDKRFAGWSLSSSIKTCIDLYREKRYDMVMSVSHPAKCHEIAKGFIDSLSGEKPLWLLYELDPYCYNEYLYGKNCYKKLSSSQHDLFAAADVLCVTPELYDHYRKTPFSAYGEKTVPVGFPNMKDIEYVDADSRALPLDRARFNCVFGGSLNDSIRNPEYALKTFALCGKAVCLSIMTDYDLSGMMEGIDDGDRALRVFPKQCLDVAHRTMERADVLVNVGNTVALQTPGKIFEYMALGKPIVHFRKIEEDPCLKYFREYPLVLIIDEREDDPRGHADMIVDFCTRYRGTTLSFDEVSKHMGAYVSESVVGGFASMVDRLLDEKVADRNGLG